MVTTVELVNFDGDTVILTETRSDGDPVTLQKLRLRPAKPCVCTDSVCLGVFATKIAKTIACAYRSILNCFNSDNRITIND